MAAEETADINLSIVREYKPPLSKQVRDRRHATTKFRPSWSVTDDVIVTSAPPRLLLHHP